jgi:hypothetical protein
VRSFPPQKLHLGWIFALTMKSRPITSEARREARGDEGSGIMGFDGVKVFSATKAREREEMSDRINLWLEDNQVDVIDKVVTQSSDREFHCLTITLFYNHRR